MKLMFEAVVDDVGGVCDVDEVDVDDLGDAKKVDVA